MKKVIDFLKWPVVYPVVMFSIIYLTWFVYTPLLFSLGGLILLTIYLLITVLLRLVSKNRILSFVLSIILLAAGGLISHDLYNLLQFVIDGADTLNRLFPFTFAGVTILIASYLAGKAIKEFPEKRGSINLLLFVSTLPILSINVLYVSIFYPRVVEKVKFGNYNYYIGSQLDSDFHSMEVFYKCNRWGFDCQELENSYSAVGWEISVDKKNKEVRLLNYRNRLAYVDGTESHWYSWEGEATLSNITYGLQYYEEDGVRRFVLNKCLFDMPESCTIIPLDLSIPQSDDDRESIVANPNSDELYILSDKKIWYVYGNQSLRYKYLNWLQLEDIAEYYIYFFQSNNTYDYFLYGCESDYFCWNMPFTYSMPDQESADLKYDEETDKLLVYIGDQLVFAYKDITDWKCYDGGCSNAQCYVKGCEILEKK